MLFCLPKRRKEEKKKYIYIYIYIYSDGTIVRLGGQWPPLNIFKFFFSVYIYRYMYVLILAICFNKFAFCLLNNIIDLFKGYKKFY